jgi:hypothetical protein
LGGWFLCGCTEAHQRWQGHSQTKIIRGLI